LQWSLQFETCCFGVVRLSSLEGLHAPQLSREAFDEAALRACFSSLMSLGGKAIRRCLRLSSFGPYDGQSLERCNSCATDCLPLLGSHSLRRSTGCCLQGSPVRRWFRAETELRRASRRRGIAHPSARSRQVNLSSGAVPPFLHSLLDAPNANGVVRHAIPQRRLPPRQLECRRVELYSRQLEEVPPSVATAFVQHRNPWQEETRTGDTT